MQWEPAHSGLSNTIKMKHFAINGSVRATGRKADVNSVRRGEKVPCAFYGKGIENINFAVEAKDLKLITDTPSAYVIDLTIDGVTYLAKLQDVQYHPVNDNAIHADFLAITEDQPVVMALPVRLFGNSEGVKAGGKLFQAVRKLKVKGLIANIPDELPVDVTTLQIGKRINAGDLKFEGIDIISPKAMIVCTVKSTRAAVAAETAAE